MTNFQRRQIKNNGGQFKRHRISDVKVVKTKRKTRRFKFKLPKTPKFKKRSGSWVKNLILRIWPYALIVIFIGGIFFVGLVAWYSRDLPDPNKIMDRSVSLSTKIYDRTGEVLLYEIHGAEKRTLITLDQIPEYVVNATIAIEDKNFYKHGGVSIWGILRGQIMPRLSGGRAQGGSTLTQQFVKNAILTNERKLSRKIKEWILSNRIEKKFS